MKHTILLIDDDPLILKTLKDRLDDWGMDVHGAQDAEGAVAFLRRIKPDLVVLDLMLNSHDGSTGILEYLKSENSFSAIPVIVLTNLEDPQLKDELLGQGIREYIVKGKISLDELEGKIKAYLEPQG